MATAPLPPPEQHLAVAAPFIYRADDPTPDLSENVAILKLENNKVVQLEPTVLPPSQKNVTNSSNSQARKESRGFFSKIGTFFASIFH
jgi:hypothetical protein